ncbi:MAG: hypothetical protein R3B13_17135 [Polyangiaceae bacterium]
MLEAAGLVLLLLCHLAVHDADLIDGGPSVTGHVAFSGKSNNDLADAGVCRFSCKSP